MWWVIKNYDNNGKLVKSNGLKRDRLHQQWAHQELVCHYRIQKNKSRLPRQIQLRTQANDGIWEPCKNNRLELHHKFHQLLYSSTTLIYYTHVLHSSTALTSNIINPTSQNRLRQKLHLIKVYILSLNCSQTCPIIIFLKTL